MNKLEGEERERFEEHYFNCQRCFQRMEEQDELISTIQSRGAWIFKEQAVPDRKISVPVFEKAFSFFTPRQWATAAAAAAVLLITIFGVLPQFKQTSPQFFLNENEVVRGASLSLISPIIDVKSVPAYFEWTKLGQDVEYKIYVYNTELLWMAATSDSRLSVPEDIKQRMVAGEKYSWQVKAFSSKGTLIAVSSKVQFQIKPGE